jgi:threonine/homoserine/homoserine lactone efflux protein
MGDIARNVLLGISLAAPIGPSGIAVIQNGLKHGFLRAFLTGIGVTMADTTYLLIVYFGLSGFISIPTVKILIWTLGALVLLYLGSQSLRDAVRKSGFGNTTASASRNPLLVGYLVNISNPIAVVWWVGIFGSLLGTTAAGATKAGALLGSSTILIGILLWHSTMSLLTHWGKRFLNDKTAKVISIVAGAALILFGIRFAYQAIVTLSGQFGI